MYAIQIDIMRNHGDWSESATGCRPIVIGNFGSEEAAISIAENISIDSVYGLFEEFTKQNLGKAQFREFEVSIDVFEESEGEEVLVWSKI